MPVILSVYMSLCVSLHVSSFHVFNLLSLSACLCTLFSLVAHRSPIGKEEEEETMIQRKTKVSYLSKLATDRQLKVYPQEVPVVVLEAYKSEDTSLESQSVPMGGDGGSS